MEAGFSIMEEFPIPPYAIDIWLPEWHLAVEVDGPGHSYHAARDRRRDERLLARGVPTLRLPVQQCTRQEVISRVANFVERHAETAAERRALLWPRQS
jgi:very-short-patch-repair endonuclease